MSSFEVVDAGILPKTGFWNMEQCLDQVRHLSDNLTVVVTSVFNGTETITYDNWNGTILITDANYPRGPEEASRLILESGYNFRTGDEHCVLYSTKGPVYLKYQFRRGPNTRFMQTRFVS